VNLRLYLTNSAQIPAEEVNAASASTRVNELAVLTEIVVFHRDRIGSMLDVRACNHAIVRYYLLCIKGELRVIPRDLAHSQFEAARELCGLLVHWNQLSKPPQDLIQGIVTGVTELFLAGDETLRNVIETGFLEHVFEYSQLVRLFSHWKSHKILAATFDAALAWGTEHKKG